MWHCVVFRWAEVIRLPTARRNTAWEGSMLTLPKPPVPSSTGCPWSFLHRVSSLGSMSSLTVAEACGGPSAAPEDGWQPFVG